MKESWLKEIARDLLALGSIPFYFLVIIRAIVGDYKLFIFQMTIAGFAVLILSLIIKNSDLHVARSLVVLIFTSMFYREAIYSAFAALVWILLLVSAFYIKRKASAIIKGLLIGVTSFAIGCISAPLI